MGINVCGRCTVAYGSEEEYLDHVCAKTGRTPREPANPRVAAKISEGALARGEARKS